MHRSATLSACAYVTLFWALASGLPTGARAYSGGPPDGYAGDPPEDLNCTSCHSSFPVNSGNGTLTLLDAPVSYTPGETYLLTVRLEDPNQRRWGFEMTSISRKMGSKQAP